MNDAPGILSGGDADHNPFDWSALADGNVACTSCGATVHPAYKPHHEAWHATITAMHVAHNGLVKNLMAEDAS